MSLYTNDDLYTNISNLKYLKLSRFDVQQIINQLSQQIIDSLATSQPIELPFFAKFGFNTKGKPTAQCTPDFLKSGMQRFTTDQKLSQSQQYKQFSFSSIENGRAVLPYIFTELSNVILFKSQKVKINFPCLCDFIFDKRTRSYTFNFVKNDEYVAPKQVQQQVARAKSCQSQSQARSEVAQLTNKKQAERARNSDLISQSSRRSQNSQYGDRSTISSNKSTISQNKSTRSTRSSSVSNNATPRRLSQLNPAQPSQLTSSLKIQYQQPNKQYERTGRIDYDCGDLQDFDEFNLEQYKDLPCVPQDVYRSKPPYYERKVAEKSRHQLVAGDSKYVADLNSTFQKTKNLCETKRQADLSRSKSMPKQQCRKCWYDQDIKQKQELKMTARQRDQQAYREWADSTNNYQVQREIENSAHHRNVQKKFHDDNELDASIKYNQKREYFLTGRYNPENTRLEQKALLADDPNLKQTLRKRAESTLQQQLIDQQVKDIENKRIPEKQEDYINRKLQEESNAQQIIRDKEFKFLQQQTLKNYLDVQEQEQKLCDIQSKYDMKCCMEESYKRNTRYDELFDFNNQIRSLDNKDGAEFRKENKKLIKKQEMLETKKMDLDALNGYVEEEMRTLAKKYDIRDDLQETYNKDIIEKTKQKYHDKVNSWQNMNEFRFRDEKIDCTQCDCCKEVYRYDNVFDQVK